MEAVVAVIAVAGTLLGALVTYLFQQRAADRAERFASAERRRDERRDSYAAFAGACAHYRRSEMDRWHRSAEDPESEKHSVAKEESYRLRSDATEALFRVQLVTKDAELCRAASDALQLVGQIHDATDAADCSERVRVARAAIDRFVHAASDSLS
ncbi:MAG TPA: hypothetical protein VGL21_08935 [Jatrophihabitantaceae bacterium]|jgi:hypothetical protein